MRTTPSTQRRPQPSSRKRRVAKPAARKVAGATVLPAVTSGVAYFTFSETGEIIITSHELAQALRKAGGKEFVEAGGVKVGVYGGLRAAARGKRKNTMAATAPKKLMAVGNGSKDDYQVEDDPQMDSMCLCDVKC